MLETSVRLYYNVCMKNTPNTTGTCIHCGKGFQYYLAPKHAGNSSRMQKYCSYKCFTKRVIPTKKVTKNCRQCGKLMMVKPSGYDRKRYCSKLCKNKYESTHKRVNRHVEKVCPICSNTFVITIKKQLAQIHCSTKCSNKAKSASPNNVWTEIVCAQCKTTVKKRTYRVKNAEMSFCSKSCHRLWVKDHRQDYYMTIECLVCHKHFEIQSWYVNVRGDAKCCSRKCLDKYNSINKTGPLNVNWKGGDVNSYGPNWSSQKRLVRKRDNYKCRLCSYSESKHKLDVHHRRPFRTFGYVPGVNDNYIQANDESNLILLCRTCHKRAEHHPELIAHLL